VGYLDELKKQSKSLQNEQDGNGDRELAESRILQELQPVLQTILRYLEELTTVLNVVKPNVSMSYEVNGYGTLGALYQRDYSVQVDNRENIQNITFCFECADANMDEKIFTIEGRDAFLRQRDYMSNNNLQFNEKLSVDGRGTFYLEPRIYTRLLFSPDVNQGKIKLQMRNFLGLGQTDRWIDPKNITQDTLDSDLGGLILRKTTDIDKLSTAHMTEDMRQQIQASLKQREQEAQKQLEERIAEEQQTQEEARLVNRLRRNFSDLLRKK
jgi:hypothetical protein